MSDITVKMITNTLYGKNEAVDVLVVAHVQQILNDEPGLINNRYNEVVGVGFLFWWCWFDGCFVWEQPLTLCALFISFLIVYLPVFVLLF